MTKPKFKWNLHVSPKNWRRPTLTPRVTRLPAGGSVSTSVDVVGSIKAGWRQYAAWKRGERS